MIGDAGRIRQVLLNLVSNAVKFTASGEVAVSTRCILRDDRQATIEWAVSDTGLGIAPEKIGSLFANFVQADNSISRRFGGSGLGLAICKRLLEQMGGEIKVASTLGTGSTFSFRLTLPVAENVAAPEQNDQDVYDALEQRIAAFSRPLRALIVDDNPTNRLVAAKMLRDFEVQIDTACDGAEAVTAANRFNYDLILMDVRMPEMDGLQATRVIRSRGESLAAADYRVHGQRLPGRHRGLPRGRHERLRRQARAQESDGRGDPAGLAGAGACDRRACRTSGAAVDAGRDAMPSPVSALDRDVFRELVREIGEEAATEIHLVFTAETEARLKLLRGLSIDTERTRIGREAHSLKSSAGTFGYRELAGLALRLEREAARLAEGEYLVLLDAMDAAYASAAALELQG